MAPPASGSPFVSVVKRLAVDERTRPLGPVPGRYPIPLEPNETSRTAWRRRPRSRKACGGQRGVAGNSWLSSRPSRSSLARLRLGRSSARGPSPRSFRWTTSRREARSRSKGQSRRSGGRTRATAFECISASTTAFSVGERSPGRGISWAIQTDRTRSEIPTGQRSTLRPSRSMVTPPCGRRNSRARSPPCIGASASSSTRSRRCGTWCSCTTARRRADGAATRSGRRTAMATTPTSCRSSC